MIKTMQKRINEIKQQDKKSYYEIANEIGISEGTLYRLMSKGELFTLAEQKITAYLKGYLTKDEKLAAYRMDNEELKAENDRLKEEMKVLQYNIAEYSNNNIDTAVTLFVKDKAKLEEENALLKAYKNKYYQQILDDEIKLNELYQTLQEIKEKCNEARRTGRKAYLPIDILDVITKAEEE